MLDYLLMVVFVLNFVPLAGCLSVLPRLGDVLSSGSSCHWPERSCLCVRKWKWLVRCLWVELFALLMLLAEASCHCYLPFLRSRFCLLIYPFVWLLEILSPVLMDAVSFPWPLETFDRWVSLVKVQKPELAVVLCTHGSCLALSV